MTGPMTPVGHLIVGPADHGVVRFAELLAGRIGGPVLRLAAPGDLTEAGLAGLAAADVVHLQYTDALYAPDTASAAAAFVVLRHRLGGSATVTLHDLPDPSDAPDRYRRRAASYRTVVGAVDAVTVCSRHEARLLSRLAGAGREATVVPLPIDRPVTGPRPPAIPEVAVLGFVYPGKGHESALAALSGAPAGVGLTAIGRTADGHDELVARLQADAEQSGRPFRITGFVPDDELTHRLRQAAVPIAPSTAISASASINTWIAAGRRPLVAAGPYTCELAARLPGAIQLYEAGELPELIAAALADPGRTWLDAAQPVGPDADEVAAGYRTMFARVGPARRPSLLELPGGLVAVPGNRWDLALHRPSPADADLPMVNVVVPYYDAPDRLELVLAGLARQDYPAGRYDVTIADDGSPVPPSLPETLRAGGRPVKLVRQADLGFRAGAARNLGAAAGDGEILCFLDADTVPSPDYLRRITRLPAVLPDALVVGRRRHVDLTGWTPDQVQAWLSGEPTDRPTPVELDEPEWLSDAYRRSGDLLSVDDRSYRFLISAVMCCRRSLFEEIDGFDESFTSYGGEDWEFAYRAFTAGAVLAHAREAVAWHDGPDWAGRGQQDEHQDPQQGKEAEREALARLIPEPLTRSKGDAGPYRHVDVVVRFAPPTDATGQPPADVLTLNETVRAVLDSELDLAAYLDADQHRAVVDLGPTGLGHDSRLRSGLPPSDVLARCRYQVTLPGPGRLKPGALAGLTERLAAGAGRIVVPLPASAPVVAIATRAERRAARWQPAAPGIDLLEEFFGAVELTPDQAGFTP